MATLARNARVSMLPAALRHFQAAGFSDAQAQAMSCIAMTENSGKSSGCNGNACGSFQILLTKNSLSGPDCAQY